MSAPTVDETHRWTVTLTGRDRSATIERYLIDEARTPWRSRVNLRGTLALDTTDLEWVARNLLPIELRAATLTHTRIEQRALRRVRFAFTFTSPGRTHAHP